MNESEIIFNIFYLLITFCIFYPPAEFIAAGLTIDNLFDKFLGSELLTFVHYHIKKTVLTLFVHSLIPLIYVMIYTISDILNHNIELANSSLFRQFIWENFTYFSYLLPICTLVAISFWSWGGWEKHPLCKNLIKFSQNKNWQEIATDINNEFRRHDKLVIKMNAITKVVATENWIIKTSPYTVYFAHQSDTALILDKSDTHSINPLTSDSVQFLNIQVKPTRVGALNFSIRINSLDFRDLQDRISRPITILSSVKFHETIIDKFIDVFKQHALLNPKFQSEQNVETCFACMAAVPNVKLNKNCTDNPELSEEENCRNCYCRPMWCIECMAKWFASRQKDFEKDKWLQQKCACPMCRSNFCILDVCYVEKI